MPVDLIWATCAFRKHAVTRDLAGKSRHENFYRWKSWLADMAVRCMTLPCIFWGGDALPLQTFVALCLTSWRRLFLCGLQLDLSRTGCLLLGLLRAIQIICHRPHQSFGSWPALNFLDGELARMGDNDHFRRNLLNTLLLSTLFGV